MTIRSLHIQTELARRGRRRQVLALVEGLEGLGHPALLAAADDGELERRAAEGLRFVAIAPKSEFDVHVGWQLARLVGDVKPSVVHAHDPMAVALAAMALQMQHGVAPPPVLVASRRIDHHLDRRAFARWKYGRVDGFLAASDVIRTLLVNDGIPADRLVVVHDGVNVRAVDKVPATDVHATFWLPHGAPTVGSAAALVPQKGHRFLVAAAARVVREVPDTRFLIIGEGELRHALEHQARGLGLERHLFLTGFRSDAMALVKSLDIFVVSSLTEALGTAVLEAMACRRPVVATRAGSIPETIVDGETGLLVPPQDDDALAAAIVRLLRDDDLRARLAEAGRARVEAEFSVERVIERTLDAYRRFLGRQ